MPDPIVPPVQGGEDPIQNLKGEFNRKLSGLDEQVKSLAETNKALLSKLDGLTKPVPATAPKAVADEVLLFEQPKEFISKMRQEVQETVSQQIGQAQFQATQQTQTLASLYEQYPELNNPNSELTKKAIENLQSMTKEEQRNPKMLKVAALEAAADLGVQPRKKRTEEEPDIAFGATRGMYTPNGELPRSMKQAETGMMELAERMGLDISKPEVVKSLKARLSKLSK